MKHSIKAVPLIIAFFAVSAFCEFSLTLNGFGAGGQLSVVNPIDQGSKIKATIGFGAQGIGEFDLGKIGVFQYVPSITYWRKTMEYALSDEWKYSQLCLNLFDIKYIFPIKKDLIFKPYAGLGPTIVINTHHYEWPVLTGFDIYGNPIYDLVDHTDRFTDGGFNIFAGCDFQFSPKVVPFVEVRMCASAWSAFKLTFGANVRFGSKKQLVGSSKTEDTTPSFESLPPPAPEEKSTDTEGSADTDFSF